MIQTETLWWEGAWDIKRLQPNTNDLTFMKSPVGAQFFGATRGDDVSKAPVLNNAPGDTTPPPWADQGRQRNVRSAQRWPGVGRPQQPEYAPPSCDGGHCPSRPVVI